MASVAESSVASVPIPKLAQLQEKLLQQPEARIDMLASGADTSATSDREAVIPESANAYSTPKSSPKAPPRFSASRSMPAGEMEAMIQPSPSQEVFRNLTRASSFHGYPGGDTQPLESQVYRDYTESVANAAITTPKKAILNVQITPDGKATYDTVTTNDRTPKTCAEGDTGYIDLVNGLEHVSPGADSTSSHMDELLESERIDLHEGEEAVKGQAVPQTPSIAGQKHGRDGEVLTSACTGRKKTPGFTQLFGGGGEKGATLGATQLFNHTQAPSSPLPDGPRSDPILTRPSPNVNHTFPTSSPVMAASSPMATVHSRPPATAGEPRENYMSMRESQERRAAKLREELGLQRYSDEDILEEDEEEDTQRRRFEQKRIHRVMSDQALHEWSKVRAPSRPGSRPTSSPKPKTTINLVTPAAAKRTDPLEFDVTDDGNISDEDVVVQDGQPDQEQPSDDEYDELAQTVLRSQSHAHEEDDLEPANDEVLDKQLDEEIEEQSEHPAKDHDELAPDGPQAPTQRSAIADSQPLGQVKPRSVSSQNQSGSGPEIAMDTSTEHPPYVNVAKASAESGLPSNHESVQETVPSSPPPLPSKAHMTSTDTTARLQLLRRQSTLQSELGPSSALDLEVPESDAQDLAGFIPPSSSPVTARTRSGQDSNSNMLFSTAQTHVSVSDPVSKKNGVTVSPLKNFISQQSKVASQSPRTVAGVRHFADIATAPSPPKGSGETDLDIDAIMSDVVTADDQQFFKAVSSPTRERPQKRRRILREESPELSSPSNPNKHESTDQLLMDGQTDDGRQVGNSNNAVMKPDAAPRPLQESLSKANELRAATPPTEDIPNSTPDSVRQREEAGAKAASQLFSTRTRKNTKPAATHLAQTSKPSIPDKLKTVKQNNQPQAKQTDTTMIQETIEDRNSAKQSEESDPPSTIASNRVFALFKGTYNNFYPATWLETLRDGLKHRVQFDDNTVAPIQTQHVRRLELRVGDFVKVDLPGMRNKTWLIKGFGDIEQTDAEHTGETDIQGHTNVKVEAKSTRTSAATAESGKEQSNFQMVAISSIYLTHTMWPHFANRTFSPPTDRTLPSSRLATPLNGTHGPDVETSATKSRRQIIPTAKVQANTTSFLREESVASPITSVAGGLFSGMAFAISYGSNEAEKADVTRMILRNGGGILENGFEELFHIPDLDEYMTSPKKLARNDEETSIEPNGLMLKPEHKELGFVALIADQHSRRAKYVQALALGLPTLSGRWIADSLDETKNSTISNAEATPLPWARYLLPSGESSYLGGATRSRTIPIYGAKESKLQDAMDDRDILLNGDGVLIVASKKSKATWEKRKAYAFLTLALGAGCVKRVSDVVEATAFVADDPEKWRWVYVDGSVAEASATMFGKSGPGGKKRKRGEESVKVNAKAMSVGDGKVKIVNDEFVVQSLILGALVD